MKIQVKHITAPRHPQVVSFEQPVINFGKKEDNHLVFALAEDGEVSGYHCQLRHHADQVLLEDLGSAQGTYLNDHPISRAAIHSGDTVRLGKNGAAFQLFFTLVPGQTSSPKAAKTDTEEKLYGQRTLGMLIAKALKSANAIGTGFFKTTDFFDALLEKKLKARTRRLKFGLILVFLLAVLSPIGAYYVINHPSSWPLPMGDNTHSFGAPIAKRNAQNIFLLAGVPKTDTHKPKTTIADPIGFCTAFSVSPNILATNAHCVHDATEHFDAVYALMNETPQKRFAIIRMLPHPDYREETISPDVALVQIDGKVNSHTTLATPLHFRQLSAGQPVFMYGFPGVLSNLAEPIATFVRGEIGRVTTLTQQTGTLKTNTLLQHSAPNSTGASGSPVFNQDGVVVGINAGGYTDEGHIVPIYSFALRVDLLHPLIPRMTGAK